VKRVLVTGGNSGIGFALCRQLAADHGCYVYLGARSVAKGQKAVAAITSAHPGVKVELVQVDVSSDESVRAAAAKFKAIGLPLYGVVNNAGTGLAHPGVTIMDILNVNLMGAKRMCEAFLPLLDQRIGRLVNVGSGAGPMYVAGRFKSALTAEERKQLADPNVTWPQIQALVAKEKAAGLQPHTAYGLSKAALAAYTVTLARDHGHITSSSCTPGFIKTAIVKGMGAKLTPDQGTVSLKHALLSPLGGNGFYFGSDGKRSPLHILRNPGEPAYNPNSKKGE